MSSIIPIIHPLSPHDARFPIIVTFTYTGFQQMTGSHLTIRQIHSTGIEEIVYSMEQSSFAREHRVPANILENGNRYSIELRVIHQNDTYSDPSNRVPFLTLTNPVLDITSIDGNAHVYNRNVTMECSYWQEQGEQVRTYRFVLLDENRDVLTRFPTRTPDNPHLFTELIEGLERNRGYFVMCEIETVNGMEWDHTEHLISLYIRPDATGIIHMENDEEEGFVRLIALLKQITGTQAYALPLSVPVTEKNEYEVKQQALSGQVGHAGFDFIDNMIVIPQGEGVIFRELNFGSMTNFLMRWVGKNVPNGTIFLELRPRGGEGGTIKFYKYSDRIIARQFVNGVTSCYVSHDIEEIHDDDVFVVSIRALVGRLDIVHQIL